MENLQFTLGDILKLIPLALALIVWGRKIQFKQIEMGKRQDTFDYKLKDTRRDLEKDLAKLQEENKTTSQRLDNIEGGMQDANKKLDRVVSWIEFKKDEKIT